MRKVILFITSSIDGYIARENGDVDWLFTDQDYGYKDFTETIDTVLMGGATYRQVLGFGGEWPYQTKNSYVFTHDASLRSNEEVTFIHHDVPEFVKGLKEKEGKNIWLIGGSQINTVLLNEDLIDEIQLFIHPVILGEGIPLFTGSSIETWFTINGIEEFDTGLMKLVYQKK